MKRRLDFPSLKLIPIPPLLPTMFYKPVAMQSELTCDIIGARVKWANTAKCVAPKA